MTAPRVTVPVEPTERLAQYVKGTSPYRAWRGVPPEGEPTLKSDIAAILSAAPAPEGGAVSEAELRDAITLILPMAKGYAAAHPVGSNQSYVDYVEGLVATREEAPADSVVTDERALIRGIEIVHRRDGVTVKLMDGMTAATISSLKIIDDAGRGVVSDLKHCTFDDFEPGGELINVTREAPAEAGEEDGAWIIYFEDRDRELESFSGFGAREAAQRRYEQVTVSWNAHLFERVKSALPARAQPPAPDALRVAVEALEKIRMMRSDRKPGSYPKTYKGGFDAASDVVADWATKALADLHAEQKGGAA